MAAILQTNKQEKWLRVSMLARQKSITWREAILWYLQYCRLYDSVVGG